ncbi:MAG: Rieske 2Fe-2S domain-containing protein [Rhodospirillales bacterium]
MSDRAPFLNRPFGAYYHRHVPKEDALLARTGPDTPCGEYLRRFWQPIGHAPAVGDLPRAITVMHEDLVLFRDGRGRLGLLQKHCCHRGTSLEYGVVEDSGIRCCYHGWQFDVDGRILDLPSETRRNTLKDRLFQGAYPVHEHCGLVFAYMGPPELMPPFPVLDTFLVPGYDLGHGEMVGVSNVKPCNWLQIIDNVVDPVHEPFLHTRISGGQFQDAHGKPMAEMAEVGELDFRETPLGLITQEARRVADAYWVRCIEYILPNIIQVARAPAFPFAFPDGADVQHYVPTLTRWRVPVDDESTVEWALVRVRHGDNNPYLDANVPAFRTNYGGRPYEDMQRNPGDYEAQISQRTIARHGLEHLTAADRGVTMMRRMVREGIHAVARGEVPKGVLRAGPGPVPTYGNETLFRAAAPPAADETERLREAARTVYDWVMQAPVASRPGARCT